MNLLPDYDEALKRALRGIEPLNRFDQVNLAESTGRVLAEAVLADRDLPPFDRAQMDGYALRASEFSPGRSWRVAHTIAAGASPDVKVGQGECVAIATGAALPRGLDAVIQHEMSDRGDGAGNGFVQFNIESIDTGHAVHRRGSDAKAGAVLIDAGTLLAAHHLGIAAAVGITGLNVRAKPQAAVLTSGDEVVAPEMATSEIAAHQIRNSNGPMVMELLRRFGAEATGSTHLPDQFESTVEAVRSAIKQSDVVITIGGVSAGDRDHFPAAFEACRVKPSLAGASIQPGRPIFVGRAPNSAIVIGLPGNPVSVLACACLFAWPIIRVLSGVKPDLPWREIVLGESVKPNANRRAFRPAMVRSDGSAIVPSWAGSGDLAHTSPTSGLVELPVQREPVPAGTLLRFLPWP